MTPALSAVPGTLTASLVLQGAGSVNSGPSAAVWLPGLIVATVFAAVFAYNQLRRRRDAPLRREMRARPVTFRSSVDVQVTFLGQWGGVNGMPVLAVHGDVFEVSDLFPPARWFGMQWYYRASDTTMEAVPGWRWRHDWIEIAPQPRAGRASRIRIGKRRMNREIWDALARAGVHPASAPPL